MGSVGNIKQLVVESLLLEEDFILIVVDPQHPQVALPDSLKKKAEPVGLHIGMRLAKPIPDLQIDAEGISATLSFDGAPFYCFLPWTSIMQLSNGEEHLIWICPPSETKNETKGLRGLDSHTANAADEGADGDDGSPDPNDKDKRKDKPKLRLV
jgi:hypothetical protein